VAYIIGNNGTEPVQVVKGAKRISFIEITPNGNVNTTTIRESGESIHSRHNAGLPSQSYGKCDIQ
jgi:hypothetical protein